MHFVNTLVSGLMSRNCGRYFSSFENLPIPSVFGNKTATTDLRLVSQVSSDCFALQRSDLRTQHFHPAVKARFSSSSFLRSYSPGRRTISQSAQLYTQGCFDIELTPSLTRVFERVDELNAQIKEVRGKANGDLSLRIHEKLRAEWTFHSNAIEGSQLSLGDTIFFLQAGLTVQGKPFKDFLDAKNHADAIDYLYEIVSNPSREIRPILMKEFNALLLEGIRSLPAMDPSGNQVQRLIHPGHYKTTANHVVRLTGELHQYVDPMRVPVEMEALFDWINTSWTSASIHPLAIAAGGHYNMVRIHPFDDGNGRCARILMNLILLKSQLQIAIISNRDRKRYLELLSLTDKTRNLEPFTLFVGEALIQTQETMLHEINRYLNGNVDS